MAKQFGLIIPGKQKQTVVQRRTVFDEDQAFDDDDEEAEDTFKPMAPKPSTIPSKIKKETKLAIDKALEEDPNVFDYDGVYDQIKEGESSKKKDFKPKYMPNLLKNSELRKRDQERREEKKIQKEREVEGDEFKDKDAFITGAYKEHLEQLRQTEERERREKELEEMFDVKKQVDLSGFHRHLLNQQIGEEDVPEISRDKYDPVFKTRNVKNQSLRSRREEDDDQDDDEPEVAVKIAPIDGQESSVEGKQGDEIITSKTEPTQTKTSETSAIKAVTESTPSTDEPAKIEDKKEVEVPVVPVKEPLDRKKFIEEIFTKRTVGEKFDEAVKRYLERKALRGN